MPTSRRSRLRPLVCVLADLRTAEAELFGASGSGLGEEPNEHLRVEDLPSRSSEVEVSDVVGIFLALAPVEASAVSFDTQHELWARDVEPVVTAVEP
jgi:hypothetical protein